jgi:serine/threonine protein phosphatase PrpC
MDDVLSVEMWKTGASLDHAAEVERSHPNVVTRIVGIRPDLEVTVSYFPLSGNDLYLLCTDGVTRQLDDYTIRQIISDDEQALADRCDYLVQTADERSGADNVTAVLLHVMG